jgi:hypothetical protein
VVAGRISCRVVRVFRLINSSAHSFYRLFLTDADITLKRFNDATHICGYIPRQCLRAAYSPETLSAVTEEVRGAIRATTNLKDAIMSVSTGEPIHRAFEMYPSLKNRAWIHCLVRPVSDWAFSEMIAELDRRGAAAAYELYHGIKGSSSAATLAGNMFEAKVHAFFQCILTPRRFMVRPVLPVDKRSTALDKRSTTFDKRSNSFDIEFSSDTTHLSFGPKQDFMGQLTSFVNDDNKSCYLKPLSSTFATFDSFLYQPGLPRSDCQPLIGFQVTTAKTHPIKVIGLQDLQACLNPTVPELEALRPTTNKKLIILFVVPESRAASWVKMPFKGKDQEKDPGKVWEGKTIQYVLGLPEEEVFRLSR